MPQQLITCARCYYQTQADPAARKWVCPKCGTAIANEAREAVKQQAAAKRGAR